MSDPSPWEGALVRLRARTGEDEPAFHAWLNDAAISRYISVRYPISHHGEREFLQNSLKVSYNHARFAVETLAEGRLIGSVALHVLFPEDRSAELGIFIGEKSVWGQGYGTDTVRTACRFAFDMMNLHRVTLQVFEENTSAIHIYEKVGFRRDAVRRQAEYSQGTYHDMVCMSLLEDELR